MPENGNQVYNRTQLLARGWSKGLLQRNPPDSMTDDGEVWSATYVERVEESPEARQILEQTLQGRAQNRLLRQVPKARIRELLETGGTLLTNALQTALETMTGPENVQADIRAVAMACHGLVLEPVTANQARDLDKRARSRPSAEEIQTAFRKSWSLTHLRSGNVRFMRRHRWVLAWLPGYDTLAERYAANLVRFARESVSQLRDADETVSVTELLSVPKVREQFPERRPSLKENYTLYYLQGMIQMKLEQLLAVEPKDEYPEARSMERKFIVHVGGTNTGKTYSALLRLQQGQTGAYLAPLRLLALEVQERLLAVGVACSMRTGEEEDIVPDETHVASTVEKAELHTHYEVAVIDECQMISDPFRGFAWTRAILGLQAEEIHLCTAPEALPLLQEILADLGDPYQVVFHERSVPLVWQEQPVRWGHARRGDAFIAFSKREVLKMAARLRDMEVPTSIIYGAMPYEARRAQMHQFLSGETTVLVATDAIGMGLNLPVRRIVFTAEEKFDGRVRRPLSPPEIKQIAGRAGRMGLYEKGYVAALRGVDEDGIIPDALTTPNPTLHHAVLGFTDLVASLDYPISDVLKAWSNQPVKAPYRRMDVSRHIRLIGLLHRFVPSSQQLSRQTLLLACGIPFDENQEKLLFQFFRYMSDYCDGASETLEKPSRQGDRLDDLELYFKKLELYYSFSKTFGYSYDEHWLREEKRLTSDRINELLTNDLEKCGPKCRICGRPLPVDTTYGVCDRCFRRQHTRTGEKTVG